MTDSDEVKLLPCPTPWCQVPSPYLQTKGDIFRVFCTSCGVATDLFRARYEAIEQWSTRPPVVTDEVVELRRLVEKWDATSEFSTDNLYLFTEALVGTVRAANRSNACRSEWHMKAGLQKFYEAADRTRIERRFVNGEGYRFFVKADGAVIGSAKSRGRAERTRKAWVKDQADKLALKASRAQPGIKP